MEFWLLKLQSEHTTNGGQDRYEKVLKESRTGILDIKSDKESHFSSAKNLFHDDGGREQFSVTSETLKRYPLKIFRLSVQT